MVPVFSSGISFKDSNSRRRSLLSLSSDMRDACRRKAVEAIECENFVGFENYGKTRDTLESDSEDEKPRYSRLPPVRIFKNNRINAAHDCVNCVNQFHMAFLPCPQRFLGSELSDFCRAGLRHHSWMSRMSTFSLFSLLNPFSHINLLHYFFPCPRQTPQHSMEYPFPAPSLKAAIGGRVRAMDYRQIPPVAHPAASACLMAIDTRLLSTPGTPREGGKSGSRSASSLSDNDIG